VDEMIAELARAQDAIDDPSPPGAADRRNLAEGYRYLLGQVSGAIDAPLRDPRVPVRQAIPSARRHDRQLRRHHFSAPVDGNLAPAARRPPGPGANAHYLIFELQAGTRRLGILPTPPGSRGDRLARLDENRRADGSEILLAPEAPAGHTGLHRDEEVRRARRGQPRDRVRRATSQTASSSATGSARTRAAHDRTDQRRCASARADPAGAAARLRRAGGIARKQMHFWNAFYAVLGRTANGPAREGPRFMPRTSTRRTLGIATGEGRAATSTRAASSSSSRTRR
jgi:hypothetical protein